MISINLTTTKSRLYLCSQTVWSLANQSKTVDQIVVWVSREPYLSDEGITEEPVWAEKIRQTGINLTFRWVKNTGPCRKLFPALREATGDDILIYADDDAIYNDVWTENLLSDFYHHNQEYVVAIRVRKTIKKKKDILDSYRNFPLITTPKVIDQDYIITGLGGVVLKKNMIPQYFHDNEDFLTVCPCADDIWISKLIQLTKTPVYVSAQNIRHIHEIIHDYGLSRTNTSKIKRSFLQKMRFTFKPGQIHYLCQNDLYIKDTDNYFESCA
ncbi:glycosyltransferase family A protein [Lelliottia sp. RWM.1]|uniref:glycosyltransferase family A protein n=1 Tax=Lelliottia sp. RWM.1 TaxID=2663242 RepID=UPI00193D06E9|nr:glycosyltransferase family A protein [Lelliottia sp. RWM.1]MBM3071998.1 glycosyltransferase [Lelliottia sp. RWM.1]